MAQSGGEIQFNRMESPLTTNKNIVTVSTAINAKQTVSSNGIHFILIVKNNSGKAIAIKNIADQLSVALYNERGLNIAIPNDALLEIHRADRKWKFRSESVYPDALYINGKEEKTDLKMLEYIAIPVNSICKMHLIIKRVKHVETPYNVDNWYLKKPTINLASGKYKLRMWLPIISNEQNKSRGFVASFESPMIDIGYGK
ncbi:hypothetical protein [Niabella soli]|nr:hypothetical protein [Niabella soli]